MCKNKLKKKTQENEGQTIRYGSCSPFFLLVPKGVNHLISIKIGVEAQ